MIKTAIAAGLLMACAVPALAKTIDVAPGADASHRLQAALIDAQPGDVINIGAGKFDVPDSLSLDVANVTVRGAGPAATILSFDQQAAGADGFLITSNGVTVENLAVENPKGNGIKAKGVDGITFHNVRVEWTAGPKTSNGAYGVYPVSSKHVLIDHVLVKGASDAGIYVGQSIDVIVQNSEAAFNVAGIEIENCYDADVHDNLATHNAGGLLAFDLPGLPQMGGHAVRIFHNRSVDNDTLNFAPKGNIVASVPTGTGVMVMANKDVAVFDNEIAGNGSVGVLLVAYVNAFTDPKYNPLPRDVTVRANKIGKNGWAPTFPGGMELAKALGGAIPPVMWDGVVTYKVSGSGETIDAPVRLAISDGPVLDLNLKTQGTPVTSANPSVTPTLVNATLTEPAGVTLPAAQMVGAASGAK
jgi:parallel beta-helix repeat protein